MFSTTGVTITTNTDHPTTTISSSTDVSPSSQSTVSTTPQCVDTDCPACTGTCMFNTTFGRCKCHCQDFVFGDSCVFGANDTSAQIDTGVIPTRNANFTLEVNITFQDAFNNLSSPQSVEFITTLQPELESLCKEADPQSYKNVQVIKLSSGSVVAVSVAEYVYTNNETQIQFVNTQLDGVLSDMLNDRSNLNKISQAFHNASVQLNELTFQLPEIKDINDLRPYVNCRFSNYTAEIINGQWLCVGPCKTNPDYCHQRGECHNDIYKGPVCRCFESSLKQFYGPQCDLFHWGPGFYGALFGSLATTFLLLIAIVIAAIVRKRHMGVWKRSNSFHRRLSAFEEDFFDFSDAGNHNLGFAGTFRPRLQNVDTRLQVTTKRPEVLNINP
ncbi:mucin-3A [Enoplosus armatus]|uniref:mucin-3A n=1 Tax=Enoplosus armatus TaxID=215367 RepID=UPI0039940AED